MPHGNALGYAGFSDIKSICQMACAQECRHSPRCVFDGIDWSLASNRIFSDADALDFAAACFGANDPQLAFFQEKALRTDGQARALMLAKLACGVGPSQADLAISSKVPLTVVNGADDAFINNDYISSLPYENLWENVAKMLAGIGHSPFWEVLSDKRAQASVFG